MDAHRVIVHVDMDHFYSAVEERRNPEYEGNPVIVGADPKGGKGRGVVSTCNYEAREFGVRSGMPISRAWNLCPTAIYVKGDYRLYREVSEKIMTILRRHSEKFQQWGLDEAFLDVSLQAKNFEEEDTGRLKDNLRSKWVDRYSSILFKLSSKRAFSSGLPTVILKKSSPNPENSPFSHPPKTKILSFQSDLEISLALDVRIRIKFVSDGRISKSNASNC